MSELTESSYFALTETISLHYRIWGSNSGVPVLFVHGGPGNDITSYRYINAKFFEPDRYMVIEVDQRGTGKSRPSVQDDYHNMQYYLDISISQMSNDFERLRVHLNVDKWLVFGGSWGSALGLDYAERYPSSCLGLIIRGIYLNTKPEFDAVYARSSFKGDERRTREFDIFFEPARLEAERRGEAPLDPDDSERFIRLYYELALRGDRDAIWRFFVFENNLVEEDPEELLDPLVIDEKMYPEATSVTLFESRLFVRGTFEEPANLLESAVNIKDVPTWVVQGTGDEVCPDTFARQLVVRLQEVGVNCKDHFVDAGHRASSSGIAIALKASVDEFYSTYCAK